MMAIRYRSPIVAPGTAGWMPRRHRPPPAARRRRHGGDLRVVDQRVVITRGCTGAEPGEMVTSTRRLRAREVSESFGATGSALP